MDRDLNVALRSLKRQNRALRDIRARLIVCLRDSGYTLQSVATEFGITRERVRQIETKQRSKYRKEKQK